MKSIERNLSLTGEQKQRVSDLCDGYRQFYDDPTNATPKVIIHTPVANTPTWEQMLADPLVMLQSYFDRIAAHLETGDDYVPAVRVDFGPPQVAAAFGCELFLSKDNTPAAGSHPLKNIEDVHTLEKPSLDAAWFPKLRQWSDIWLENLPEGVLFQQPDIQGPLNTAHLIRGNDIFLDFQDDPQALDKLLSLVADFMIELVPALNAQIGNTTGWFADWGMLWKGFGRLSNCTSSLIGPDLYKTFVLPHDMRVLEGIKGGRMHCCGSSTPIIEDFAANPRITGLDFDAGIHDPWQISEIAAPHVSLIMDCYGQAFPFIDRLLEGDWPRKRNITIVTKADSIPEARALLKKLRESIPA